LFALVAALIVSEPERQRREVFQLISTVSPETSQIVDFATEGYSVFGKPSKFWVIECKSADAVAPPGAVIAVWESDRQYVLDELTRTFAGSKVPKGDERVWVLAGPEGEVEICISRDARFMWVWRHGR